MVEVAVDALGTVTVPLTHFADASLLSIMADNNGSPDVVVVPFITKHESMSFVLSKLATPCTANALPSVALPADALYWYE